ncbi:hypothetical protein SSX86_023295 [Deinandra increscens subsp. villosa]|uniref:Uncharacterized protein n=1 Tax=Deinandra increscens subsp. villosa TaxID=3103831 RepID=A0AAP0GPS5_9ASTR
MLASTEGSGIRLACKPMERNKVDEGEGRGAQGVHRPELLEYRAAECRVDVKALSTYIDSFRKEMQVAAREEMQVVASLSDITPTGEAFPVQIRVLNKWRPYHEKPTLSYLFVNAECSHPEIEVTLWEEIGSRVDLQALIATEHVVIVAITALKVTRHPGTGSLQLQSTVGTSVNIDPDIQLARAMASVCAALALPQDHDAIRPPRLHLMEKPSERKRHTLGTIRNEDPMLIPRAVYTCEAKVVSIDDGQTRIVDATGTTTVTMFGSDVASMLGVSCYNMIHDHGNNDNIKMPALMNSMKGVTKIFQLEKGKLDHTGLRFAINKVFAVAYRAAIMHTTSPEKGTGMASSSNSKEASASTGLIQTKARKALFDRQGNIKKNNTCS